MDFGARSLLVLPAVERGQEAVGISGSEGLFEQLLEFAVLCNLSLIRAWYLGGND